MMCPPRCRALLCRRSPPAAPRVRPRGPVQVRLGGRRLRTCLLRPRPARRRVRRVRLVEAARPAGNSLPGHRSEGARGDAVDLLSPRICVWHPARSRPGALSFSGWRPGEGADLAELAGELLPGNTAVGRAIHLTADAAGVDELRIG